jgi:hypothetical protein
MASVSSAQLSSAQLSSAQLSSAKRGVNSRDRQVAKWEQVGKELKAKLEQARSLGFSTPKQSAQRLQDETYYSAIYLCCDRRVG